MSWVSSASGLPPCLYTKPPSPSRKTPGRVAPVGTPSARPWCWHHPFLHTPHCSMSVTDTHDMNTNARTHARVRTNKNTNTKNTQQRHSTHKRTCLLSGSCVCAQKPIQRCTPDTRSISAGGHRKQMKTSQVDQENCGLPFPAIHLTYTAGIINNESTSFCAESSDST